MILKHLKSSSRNDHENDKSILLPGLPNHLALLCLSTLPPSLLFSVCRSWRHLIFSPSFPPFYSLYAIVSPISSEKINSNAIEIFTLNPISLTWQQLPNPFSNPPISLLRRHPSFISRNFQVQSISVSNHLVIIAATNNLLGPALACPLVFNPLSPQDNWVLGPKLLHPRRWCAMGSMEGSVYVASGVGSRYQSDVARTLEKWDMTKNEKEWKWEKLAKLRDGRFSREAIQAIGCKGKLYMVNVKGSGRKEGTFYDVAEDRWYDMPAGMLAGWNGPAGSDCDCEGNIYVVDEKEGLLSKYDHETDEWIKILGCCEYMKGAEQIVVKRGKVCVVCAKGERIFVVDVAVEPACCWVVDQPPGMEVVSLNIMPRMCYPE